MKRINKILTILLIIFLPLILFTFTAFCDTTFGDTTFPVDEGESLIWYASSGPPSIVGNKISYETTAIFQGDYLTIDCLIVNCTLQSYEKSTSNWTIEMENGFYMAANSTLDFFTVGNYLYDSPMLFAIPIPINLTTAGQALIGHTGIYNYAISGNKLISIASGGVSYEQTFNDNGILTRFETKLDDETFGVIKLGTGGGGDISFGSYFLIFSIIGIFGLIYTLKRRIN